MAYFKKSAVFLLLLALVGFKLVESGYVITTPRVYRAGSVQTLNVDLHGDDAMWNITAYLKISESNKTISQASKIIHGNSQVTLDIQVPEKSPVIYNDFDNVFIQVHGVAEGKPEFKREHSLILKIQENTIFIQTDKPIYKPGQTIRMRVIAVKPDLKPIKGKIEELSISNPAGVRIMQWNNVELKNGIAGVETLLSKHPVLGKWKIQARYDGDLIKKFIEVSKYVLPKFEVVITPPSFIALDSKVVSGSICAKYTYGQLVTGTLRAEFDFQVRRRWYWGMWHRPIGIDSQLRLGKNITVKKQIKGCYEFSFTDGDLGLQVLRNNSGYNAVLKIKADVIEEATGIKRVAASKETEVERQSVKLDFDVGTPMNFKPGLPFHGKLRVTSPDGQPIAHKKIIISIKNESRTEIFNKEIMSPPSGIIDFYVDKMPHNNTRLDISARQKSSIRGLTPARKSKYIFTWFSPSSSFLSLKKVSKPFKVGAKAKINFQCTQKTNRNLRGFIHQLMCGGKVVLSKERPIPLQISKAYRNQKIKVAEGSIEFLVSQAMVPSCRLLVYYVRKDGETVADSMVVDVEDKLENQVVVRFSDNVRKPGEPVQVIMTATPGSTVALAGVDKSVRLLKEAEDIDTKKVIDVLSSNDIGPTKRHSQHSPQCFFDGLDNKVDSSKAFYDAGLIFLSDSIIDSIDLRRCRTPLEREISRPLMLFSGIKRRKKMRRRKKKLRRKQDSRKTKLKKVSTSTVRKNFPETWLWIEESISNMNGQKNFTAKVPDTITSWHLGAFAMSSTTGMGVASPSSLTVFQPFFVSFTLPYSVIRGEQVSIVTTVFNYMDKCATVRISLTKTDHFQLLSPADQKRCVCGNEAKSVKYLITPAQLGRIPLTVTVQNVAPSMCENPADEASLGISDAVTRKLLVEPEGVRKEYTYSNYICPRDNAEPFKDQLQFSLPKKIVPGSVFATISAIGDIMGPSLSGLEGLLRLPTGCGEQNMVKFAPNIFIMQYLDSTKQLTSTIKTKAVGFLRTGYQRELTYKRKDGSYSAFGNRDKEGSLWLTAFVLRSFSQARQFIFVDKDELKATKTWIESKQLSNGCFKKHGRLFNKRLKGGVSTPVTLTAYILISLLESKVSPKNNVIVKGVQCITAKKYSVTDAYSNAIIAYALTLAKHPSREEFLTRLKNQATIKDGQMYWEEKEKPKKQAKIIVWEPPYRRSSSSSIEMTSYALMAFIGDGRDSREISKALPIVQWISKQRNALGGFSSTQDTCVALQALSKYARYVYTGATSMKIDVGHFNDTFSHRFHINDRNLLVLQRVEMPAKILPIKNIPINASGKGCALLQANVLYNVPDVEETPAFNLTVSVRRPKVKRSTETTEAGEELCQPLEVNVCAKWLEDAGSSGMAVIDVKMVSGFIPDEESLERLMKRDGLNLMKFELEENKAVFYFDEIKDTCFGFEIHQTSVVKKTKPASVTVYEYYDTDNSATTMYKINDILCNPKAVSAVCPLCPTKPDLKNLRSPICEKNTVLSMRTRKDGQTVLEFLARRHEINSTTWTRKDDIPFQITLPEGCRCPAIQQPSNALVLLKKKTADKKLKRLDLDENALVLDRKGIPTIAFAIAIAKCP